VLDVAGKVRQIGQAVYSDAEDSWLLEGRTRSAKETFRADYTVPGNYAPFRWWCNFYRYPATAYAMWSDARKWLFVHPVRGPLTFLFLLVSAALVGLAVTN
jgi:hypothetical protein